MAGEEAIRGRDFVPVHLVVPGFNVDEGELPFVFRAEARQDFAAVDLITSPGDLVSAVAGYLGHGTFSPLAETPFYHPRRLPSTHVVMHR